MSDAKITERSWVPLGSAIAVGLGLFSGGWVVKGAIASMERTLVNMDTRIAAIESAAAERWSVSDMERFGYLIEKNNRQLPLWVPDPRDVKRLQTDIKQPTKPQS